MLWRHGDHRGIHLWLGQITTDAGVFPEPMVPQGLVSSTQAVALDALGSQHTGGHASRVAVIADDQHMTALQLGDAVVAREQSLEFGPLCLQHGRVREGLRAVRVQAVQRHVHRVWEVPGGKVQGGAQVDHAASGPQYDVRQQALGCRLRGFVKVREEHDGAAFPAFVVAVAVDL